MTDRPRHPCPASSWLACLYFRAIAREFRWTFATLAGVVLVGAALYAQVPRPELNGDCPSPGTAVYCAWMALLAQQVFQSPAPWFIELVNAIYPLLGVLLFGEGVVRFAMLMISRRQGEKEWMKVMASVYRDHVVLCGIGHLGYRVLEELVKAAVPVVAIEKTENGRFVSSAKALGVPVLIRDMKEDQALIEAGIPNARVVIIATNDDMANLEVALDSRRMNPAIRIVMRLFDQQIASKIAEAISVDAAFSASALAAPVVAAMSTGSRVMSSMLIGGVPHVTAELAVTEHSPLAGQTTEAIEKSRAVRVLARILEKGDVESPPDPATPVRPGDKLVVHCRTADLAALATGQAAVTA